MNIRLNSFSTGINTSYNALGFRNRRRNAVRYGLALAASMMLLTACNSNQKNNQEENTTNIELENSSLDDIYKNSPHKVYHYTNPRKQIDINDYDWSETIYPDGRIIRDSAGLKIYISPEKERTIEEITKDRYNNEIITTKYPDGKKVVRKNFFLKNSNESQYTEKTYNKYDILIEYKYYNKMYTNADKERFTTEELYEKYNDKGVLLKWETNKKIANSDTISNYDKLGRITYDLDKNEHYEYKGNDTVPIMSYQIYKGCKHVKEYNLFNNAYKIYFEAADGTITE